MTDVQNLSSVAAVVDPSMQAARQPRGMVRLNGTPCPAWIEWSVDSNSYHEADTFEVSLSVSHMTALQDLAWLISQDQISVEVFGGFPEQIRGSVMRILACFTLVALAGCATTNHDYAYDRPASAQSPPGPVCSSSGNNATACAAGVVVSAILHQASN